MYKYVIPLDLLASPRISISSFSVSVAEETVLWNILCFVLIKMIYFSLIFKYSIFLIKKTLNSVLMILDTWLGCLPAFIPCI